MKMYEVSPDHMLREVKHIFPFRLRVVCICGWRTRGFWNPDKAANSFFLHQAQTGTKIPGQEGGG
jgi:hypothetical protein